jgi:phage baseplate assembly protein W
MSNELSFKSVGIKTDDPNLFKEVQINPIGIKTPVELSTKRSGLFKMHYSVPDQIADNLRNLILTNYGERLGRYDYGANLRPLAFELTSLAEWEAEVMIRINTAVSKFMPFVDLQTFSSEVLAQKMSDSGQSLSHMRINIKFSVPKVGLNNRQMSIGIWCVG